MSSKKILVKSAKKVVSKKRLQPESENIKSTPVTQLPTDDASDEETMVNLFAPKVAKKILDTTTKTTKSNLTSKNTPAAEENDTQNSTALEVREKADGLNSTRALTREFNLRWNNTPYNARTTFTDLGLGAWSTRVLKNMRILKPTEIQQRCITEILKGQNVIGRAKTGSGKTAAFALPIIQTLSEDPFGIYALILTPTRELASQIAEQFRAFGLPINLETCVVIGGVNAQLQAQQLERRPHVVIATPGRLAELLSNSSLEFHGQHLKYLVLDEADRLFEDCFIPCLRTICEHIPPVEERQTLMFSATITKPMLLATMEAQEEDGDSMPILLTNPVFVEASTTEDAVVDRLDQRYVFIPQTVKEAYLVNILAPFTPGNEKFIANRSVVIFASTCRGAEFISQVLSELGIPCVSLHSKLNQARRTASLAKFRSGSATILVATDVASRGLDIPSVHLVVNYDVPRVAEDYIHRVGRTARAGRSGMAVTLVSQYDISIFKTIEESIHKTLPEMEIDENEILATLKKVTEAKKMATMHLASYSMQSRTQTEGIVVNDGTGERKTKRIKPNKD